MANPPANPNQTPPAEPIDETPTPPNPHPIGTPEYEGFAKALAEIQQRRTEPAPPTSDDHRLAQAFVWALRPTFFSTEANPIVCSGLAAKNCLSVKLPPPRHNSMARCRMMSMRFCPTRPRRTFGNGS